MSGNQLDQEESEYIENYDPKKIEWEKGCVDDHVEMKKKTGKFMRFMIYGIVSILGIAFAVLKIVNLLGG